MASRYDQGDPVANKRYRPYDNTSLDTPVFHLMLEPILPILRPLLRPIYGLRWMLSRPLEIRIVPKWVPVFHMIPIVRDLPYLTIGELLLTVPLVVLFLAGYNSTFVSPALEQSGTLASYALYATFLTANKSNSLFSFLFGISFERMIPFHFLASILTIVLGCFHTYVAFSYGDQSNDNGEEDDTGSPYSLVGPTPDLYQFLLDDWNNFSGTFLVFSLAGLVLLSIFPFIRRYMFDLWLTLHIILAMNVIIFSFIHDVTFILAVGGWWIIDLMARYIVMAGVSHRTKLAKLRVMSCGDVVQVSFPKIFEYNPGQFVKVCIPKVSSFQFHPVSISSAPNESMTTLHIRALGDWTKQLLKVAQELQEDEDITIMMEGPYGSLSVDIDDDKRYKMVLLVSGGIGVTHIQSVGKALEYQHFVCGRELKKLRYVWSVRNRNMIEDISPLGGDPHGRALQKFRHGQEELSRRSTTKTDPNDSSNGPGFGVTSSSSSSSDDEESPSNASYSDDEDNNNNNNENNNSISKVQIDVHCTTKGGGGDEEECCSYETAGYNLIANKRPNMDEILREMKAEAKILGESNIAVFGCGPTKLIDSLRDACRKHSSSTASCGEGIFFDLHTEIFEF